MKYHHFEKQIILDCVHELWQLSLICLIGRKSPDYEKTIMDHYLSTNIFSNSSNSSNWEKISEFLKENLFWFLGKKGLV